ncbi:MAG: MFS transporter [Holosporaceae bacterium]|jgi:MHS family proline/betaine transporter-like MFS transporter|nr:MFS transporter [Holosporaceae bacterium]
MPKINLRKYETVLSTFGNIFEWYSFALFMPFLPVLSKQFFPMENAVFARLLTFFALSIGLFMRPFGAIIFGPIGDKFGRQKAISFSILLMAIPTICIGLLPSYHDIGIASPVILIFLRALQGISLGGEYTAAMVHLVERAPANRRGFYGSWSDGGSQIGVLIGGQALVMLYSFYGEHEIYSFAWRAPFLLAIVLLPFAFMVPNQNGQSKKKFKEPLLKTVLEHKKEAGCTIAITAFSAVGFYTLFTFLPYYLVSNNILTLKQATQCSVASNMLIIVFILFFGYLSDKFKRKPFMIFGISGVSLVTLLMFVLQKNSFSYWFALQFLYGFFMGAYYSSRAAFFAEAFPTKIRCTAVSLSLSLAQAIFGGLTPTVMSFCQEYSNFLAAVPILIVAAMAIYAISLLEDRTGKDLV